MSLSAEAFPSAPASPTRVRRHIAFRIIVAAIALLLIVGFGVWLSILTPWVSFADTTDHGWTRTPELHRTADTASAAAMGAVGAAGIVLAVLPRRRSALTAWFVAMVAAMGITSLVSSVIQGHDLVGATIFALGWLALLVVPTVLLAPDRRSLPAGGVASEDRPRGPLLAALWGLVVAGALIAVGAIVWRLAGGITENPREDDVIGFVLLGLAFALGGAQCLRARESWRTLAIILAAVTAYTVVAGVSLALG
ncbi:hypothetical protein OG320_24885 [Microbispora sp. NBC_01189]|uniref:hypothetical protein n=1 Tax=Microbispora sp. NBC_01189 TaxID=2903583 RepID=UPI002E0F6E75|nr:hypothetical protein OG320_24885 [Microbispora sp. NBC_01189]